MDELLRKLEMACWNFYHRHIGTVEHLNSKNRIYEIADELKEKYGVNNEVLIAVCEKARK